MAMNVPRDGQAFSTDTCRRKSGCSGGGGGVHVREYTYTMSETRHDRKRSMGWFATAAVSAR